jgi:hypothetical protein
MFRRRAHTESENSSDTLADLALSVVGLLAIIFAGYVLKFRSEFAAVTAGPNPPGATAPGPETNGPTPELLQAIAQADLLRDQVEGLKLGLQHERNRREGLENSLGDPRLFGLNGPLTGVAICLDLSGSMIGHDGTPESKPKPEVQERFEVVKERLARLVRALPFQRFTVLGFGGEVHDGHQARLIITSQELQAATPEARDAAARSLVHWQASGGTPTLPALKATLRIEGVEHVILLTDGMPNIGGDQVAVLQFLRSEGRGRVIDVIGVGDQSVAPEKAGDSELLTYTRRLALENGGFFQAW